MSPAALPVSVWSLICCAEAVQSPLSSSSEGFALSIGVNSMCPWEEGSSGSSYATILDQKPPDGQIVGRFENTANRIACQFECGG